MGFFKLKGRYLRTRRGFRLIMRLVWNDQRMKPTARWRPLVRLRVMAVTSLRRLPSETTIRSCGRTLRPMIFFSDLVFFFSARENQTVRCYGERLFDIPSVAVVTGFSTFPLNVATVTGFWYPNLQNVHSRYSYSSDIHASRSLQRLSICWPVIYFT